MSLKRVGVEDVNVQLGQTGKVVSKTVETDGEIITIEPPEIDVEINGNNVGTVTAENAKNVSLDVETELQITPTEMSTSASEYRNSRNHHYPGDDFDIDWERYPVKNVEFDCSSSTNPVSGSSDGYIRVDDSNGRTIITVDLNPVDDGDGWITRESEILTEDEVDGIGVIYVRHDGQGRTSVTITGEVMSESPVVVDASMTEN